MRPHCHCRKIAVFGHRRESEMKSSALPVLASERIKAKAKGYSFRLYDSRWRLDKNTTVNLDRVHQFLSGDLLEGYLRALAFYASNLSAHHTKNCAERFQHMLCAAGATEITDVVLINYRASLTPATEWYLSCIRGFLRRWYKLGYYGVSKSVIILLDGWRIKGNRKGDAVKRKDPEKGPLTDNELQAFNEGAIQVYEKSLISLSELAISLAVSNTGRRPVQLSHLRIIDVLRGENKKGEPFYLLNVPRGKQGDEFRTSFKPFAMKEELWAIMNAQAKNAAMKVERQLGCKLKKVDRQEIPLFPDHEAVSAIKSLDEFRLYLKGDKLHIAAADVTDTLQFVVEAAEIKSERTGKLLQVNARRFRYTTGTRAAREGFGELVIAELLDHSDTQNAGVYIKNIPEHVERLDEAVGFQLAPYAQAFVGILVDCEKDAKRGDDPTSCIRNESGEGVGTCCDYGFCGANVPIPCYTCMHFRPWLNGPHKEVYHYLLAERERVKEVTGDIEIAAVLDRSIVAVADVIMCCARRREELNMKGMIANG